VFRPGPADGAARSLSSVFTVDPSGTVHSYPFADPDHPVVHSTIARGALSVVQIADQLLVTTASGSGYQIAAYPAGTANRAVWTWPAPPGAGRPSTPQPCGTTLVCVADTMMTRIIDTRTGVLAGAFIGNATLAYGLADRYVVALTADGSAVVASPDGTVQSRFPNAVAYPLSGTSLLVLTDPQTDRPTVTVFDADADRSYLLGRIPANPTACDWGATDLACAATTLREWKLTR
jgi:hypothetical protein